MKHTCKPHSEIIRQLQGRRFAERCLWTGERPIAFYALAEDNTTQKRKWIYIEAMERGSNPRFLCTSISRWSWRSTAQNCKCYGPVPYVSQRSTAMFISIRASRKLCCSKTLAAVCFPSHGAAVAPKPRTSSRLPAVFNLSVHGRNRRPLNRGFRIKATGGRDVTASKANCLYFKCLTFLSCFIFLA